jgi:hypothetical protein
MSPRAMLEQAARELEPDTQGRLDGLCGIYATINGIRVALYPNVQLKPSQRRRLFITGVEALQRSRLLGWAVHDGMTPATFRKVSRAIANHASDIVGFDVALLPAIDRQHAGSAWTALRAMRRQLKMGSPLLITLWGPYNHTTVVTGFSKTRLTLFDSYGMRWVGVRSIACSEEDDGRHRLIPNQVLAVGRVEI